MQIQRVLQSQGIKGPPYIFLDGNTTEIIERKRNSMSRQMQISDDVFETLQPHIHLWAKIYGTDLSSFVCISEICLIPSLKLAFNHLMLLNWSREEFSALAWCKS